MRNLILSLIWLGAVAIVACGWTSNVSEEKTKIVCGSTVIADSTGEVDLSAPGLPTTKINMTYYFVETARHDKDVLACLTKKVFSKEGWKSKTKGLFIHNKRNDVTAILLAEKSDIGGESLNLISFIPDPEDSSSYIMMYLLWDNIDTGLAEVGEGKIVTGVPMIGGVAKKPERDKLLNELSGGEFTKVMGKYDGIEV